MWGVKNVNSLVKIFKKWRLFGLHLEMIIFNWNVFSFFKIRRRNKDELCVRFIVGIFFKGVFRLNSNLRSIFCLELNFFSFPKLILLLKNYNSRYKWCILEFCWIYFKIERIHRNSTQLHWIQEDSWDPKKIKEISSEF